jgi:hypothetical protein
MEIDTMQIFKNLCILIFIGGFAHLPNVAAQTGERPINPNVLELVVKIETFSEREKKPITGTGFIVSRETKLSSGSERITFLVTNKHMLSDWTSADGTITNFNKYLQIHFYRVDSSPENPTHPLKIDLCDTHGRVIDEKVQVHSNPLVDVAIVILNNDLSQTKGLRVSSFDVSFLLPFGKITAHHFDIGSQVFVLGYPLGITSLRSSYPIAKFGYMSSIPGEEFSIKLKATDRKGVPKEVKLEGKLLIIDGLIVGGNSGGPVILPSVIKTRINPETQHWERSTKPSENLVIGVLAGGFEQSGLSYVYSSDYIIETIDEHLKNTKVQPAAIWP